SGMSGLEVPPWVVRGSSSTPSAVCAVAPDALGPGPCAPVLGMPEVPCAAGDACPTSWASDDLAGVDAGLPDAPEPLVSGAVTASWTRPALGFVCGLVFGASW